MSEEQKTQEMDDARPFEERVLAHFEALSGRLDRMDERLHSLEAKQYDTKPIWERALTEIAETRKEMQVNFRKIERQLSALSVDVLETRGTVSDLESRVDKIDKSPVSQG